MQVNECERIKKDVEKFAAKVRNYKLEIRKKPFYKYATGAEQAYPEIDAVATELLALRKECDRLHELASIFEFPQVSGSSCSCSGRCSSCSSLSSKQGPAVCNSLQREVTVMSHYILTVLPHLPCHL